MNRRGFFGWLGGAVATAVAAPALAKLPKLPETEAPRIAEEAAKEVARIEKVIAAEPAMSPEEIKRWHEWLRTSDAVSDPWYQWRHRSAMQAMATSYQSPSDWHPMYPYTTDPSNG